MIILFLFFSHGRCNSSFLNGIMYFLYAQIDSSHYSVYEYIKIYKRYQSNQKIHIFARYYHYISLYILCRKISFLSAQMYEM